MSGSVTVDNASSRIQYSGGWNSGDVHTTGAGGSSATFNFLGNIVSVVGTIPQGNGEEIRVDFSIDGRAPTSVTRRTGSTRRTGEVWFSSDYLATYSPHTVVVTFRSGPQFQLEQFRYEGAPGPGEPEVPPPPTTPPPSTTSIPPTSTRSVPPSSDPTTTSDPTSTRQSSTTSTTPTTAETETETETDSSTDSSSSTNSGLPTNTGGGSSFVPNPSDAATLPGGESSNAGQGGATKAPTPTGAIVGAVVGSLAFLAMMVIIILLLRRRRRSIALADVSLRDESMGPYGSSASYAHSATGLVNYNSSAPPPMYTPPQSVVYVPQPVTKRRMSNGSGGHGSGQEHYTDASHSNNYNHTYNANQAGPSQQYYDSGASISGSTNFAGLGTAEPSGSGIPMHQIHHHPGAAAHNPMQMHQDTSDTASSAYSAYTGIAPSETAVQRSLGHGASGHQQHPSVSAASDVSAPASLTPLRRQDTTYSRPPPAY